MLELIILIVPGVAAALLHCRLNKMMQWKKIVLCALSYIICINLIIFTGLWIVGMRHFSLFEMSLSFKLKWLALGFALAVFLIITFNNLRKMNIKAFTTIIKKMFPASLLFIITYAIFAPSLLFLENISEFPFSYLKVLPIVLCIALILWFVINAAALCLTNEKTVLYYIALLFSFSVSADAQRNFLNPHIPSLDGTEIDWAAYASEGIRSAAFWIVCILACLAVSYYFKEKAEKIIKYFSYFLCMVQMLSLIIVAAAVGFPEDNKPSFFKDDQFTLGSEDNIVIFIIDTLQAPVVEEYLASASYPSGSLDDFTFFDNAVSGAAPTEIAVPLLLTGVEYDPMQSLEEYQREKWEEISLYDDLHAQGYDIRFFSSPSFVSRIPDDIADNYGIAGEGSINDKPEFIRLLYQLANFYQMPQFLKNNFWTSTDAILDTVYYYDNTYSNDNVRFYKDMHAAGQIQTSYDKALRLYHLRGVHRPLNSNEKLESVPYGSVNEMQQFTGIMLAIYEYIDEMKRLGVYDTSTIIITGDHGRHEDNNTEANPAVLIKQPSEQHELEHNSAPINFRNVTATIAKHFMDDYSAYGPCVNDITQESDVERLHTIDSSIRERNYIDDEWDSSLDYCRLIVPNELDELYEPDKYQVWDPHKINRIDYELGENIDFTADNEYANQINYRLYKENNSAAASNELSICFNITDYNKKDLEFHFKYSDIYNSKQNIRIYANGSKIETITCTEENAGTDQFVTIPEKLIKNKELIIRMVFPNAVTPHQLDKNNTDTRVLSIVFDSMRLE